MSETSRALRRLHARRLLQAEAVDAHFAEFELLNFAGHRRGIFIHENAGSSTAA